MGPAPITYRDVEAWSNVTGIRPRGWEVDMLFAIDAKYLAMRAADHKADA
jgi:hypothetical protein